MPEETTTDAESAEQGAQAPGIVHDDIMQRLLEYQRQLREGVAPHEAAEAPGTALTEAPAATTTEIVEVVDITEAEPELEAVETKAEEAADEAPEIVEILDVVEDLEIEVIRPPEVEEPAEELSSTPTSSTTARTRAKPAEPSEPTPPESVPAAPTAQDLHARVAELEDALARVSAMVAELRSSLQDMAIAANERLALVEETLAGIGSPNQN